MKNRKECVVLTIISFGMAGSSHNMVGSKRRKLLCLLLLAANIFLFPGCEKEKTSIHTGQQEKKEAERGRDFEMSRELVLEVYEKGYELPIADSDREEAEKECKEMMNRVKEIYKQAEKGDSLKKVISKETVHQMMETLKKTEAPISASVHTLEMYNYEKMETFLNRSMRGELTEIVTYEINTDGGITRRKFLFDEQDMYVLNTNAVWSENDTPTITMTSSNRIKEWEYTEKGWFCYEYCVPEPPEVSEIVDGNVMVRVKPPKKNYQEMAETYLYPFGYQGNNLLCSNWDAEHMEDLDFNGLFQYLFYQKYQQIFDSESYLEGIPKEEFERLIMEYLPISAEQLRQYAAYDAESETYTWIRLGCGNYVLNAFGTSIPEITHIQENEDGTTTLTVDAVCELLGNDAVISHKLTVQFKEDGGITYLGNQLTGDGLEKIPTYQYRIRREN